MTATIASARATESTLSAMVSAACFAAKLSAEAACSVEATEVFMSVVASGRLGVELLFLLVRTLCLSFLSLFLAAKEKFVV